MKLNKRITGLFLCSVLLFGTCGCQQSLEDNQEKVKIEESQLDIEKLDYEYNAMINLAEDLFKMFEDAEGKIDGGKAIEIIQFVQNNRIKPTQELTIALEEYGIDKDISYCATTITNDIEEIQKLISEGKIIDIVEFAKKIALATFKKEDPFVVYYLNKDLLQEENKMWHRFFFDVLALIYQEAIKLKGNKELRYFKSIFKEIADLSDINLNKKLELIIENQRRLNYYVSMPLFYTNFFCQLGKDN
jgi:hypothetical protein